MRVTVENNFQLSTFDSQLPKGWDVKKLGDVCTIQLGKTPHRKTERYWDKDKNTSNCWLSIADMVHGKELFDSKEYVSNLGTENINITPKGTLILSFKLTLGRVSFAGKDLFTNEAIASLINLSGGINKKYLFYYFTFFDWDKATDGDIKVKGKTLNKAKLKALPIMAPPLPEQQRIVKILDKAFFSIDNAKLKIENNLSNAKGLFESYLNEVFSNGKLKVENGEWEEKTLGEVCENIFAGGDKPKEYSKFKTTELSIPIYANAVKLRGLYGFTNVARVTNPSVTISARGSGTGHTELRKECYLPIVRLIVVIPNSNTMNLDFLKHAIDSLDILRSGSAIPQLTVPMIKKYPISFPSIQEQKQIVKQLDKLSSETKQLEANYQQKMDKLGELKKSILQKAFNGEL